MQLTNLKRQRLVFRQELKLNLDKFCFNSEEGGIYYNFVE